MPQSGPKRLTAAQLKARGARPDRVRAREAEEKRATVARVPVPAVQEVHLPDGLIDAEALSLFEHVARHYKLEPIGTSVLMQTCWALQRGNQCRKQIDGDGVLCGKDPKPTAHPLLRFESEARTQYCRLLDKLGMLD